MRFSVQLIVCTEESEAETQYEVAVLEKDYQRIEQLGLTLAEAKHLLKQLQQHLVEHQAAAFVLRHSQCPACGLSFQVKERTTRTRGRMAPSGARPSTGPEKRSAPRAGQRLGGVVASRWRPPARSLRGRDRRGQARVSLVSVEVVVLGAGERATRESGHGKSCVLHHRPDRTAPLTRTA